MESIIIEASIIYLAVAGITCIILCRWLDRVSEK